MATQNTACPRRRASCAARRVSSIAETPFVMIEIVGLAVGDHQQQLSRVRAARRAGTRHGAWPRRAACRIRASAPRCAHRLSRRTARRNSCRHRRRRAPCAATRRHRARRSSPQASSPCARATSASRATAMTGWPFDRAFGRARSNRTAPPPRDRAPRCARRDRGARSPRRRRAGRPWRARSSSRSISLPSLCRDSILRRGRKASNCRRTASTRRRAAASSFKPLRRFGGDVFQHPRLIGDRARPSSSPIRDRRNLPASFSRSPSSGARSRSNFRRVFGFL